MEDNEEQDVKRRCCDASVCSMHLILVSLLSEGSAKTSGKSFTATDFFSQSNIRDPSYPQRHHAWTL